MDGAVRVRLDQLVVLGLVKGIVSTDVQPFQARQRANRSEVGHSGTLHVQRPEADHLLKVLRILVDHLQAGHHGVFRHEAAVHPNVIVIQEAEGQQRNTKYAQHPLQRPGHGQVHPEQQGFQQQQHRRSPQHQRPGIQSDGIDVYANPNGQCHKYPRADAAIQQRFAPMAVFPGSFLFRICLCLLHLILS